MSSTRRHAIVRAGGVLLPLLLWLLGAAITGNALLLPGPAVVIRRTLALLMAPGFWLTVAGTAARAFVSTAIMLILALPLGTAAGRNQTVAELVKPSVVVVRSVPFISVILLALIWFPAGLVPVFVSLLMTFPLMYEAARVGSAGVPKELTEMAAVYRLGGVRFLRHVVLPSAAPILMGTFRSAMGMTWKVVVAAEVFSQPPEAVGTRLNNARLFLETENVFAWTVVLILLSGVTELLLRVAEERVLGRRA